MLQFVPYFVQKMDQLQHWTLLFGQHRTLLPTVPYDLTVASCTLIKFPENCTETGLRVRQLRRFAGKHICLFLSFGGGESALQLQAFRWSRSPPLGARSHQLPSSHSQRLGFWGKEEWTLAMCPHQLHFRGLRVCIPLLSLTFANRVI